MRESSPLVTAPEFARNAYLPFVCQKQEWSIGFASDTSRYLLGSCRHVFVATYCDFLLILTELTFSRMHVTSEDFEEAAKDMLKRPARGCVAERRWKAFFGVTPAVCLIVWCKLDPLHTMPKNTQPYHLLWALFFLMVHPTEEIATAICDCDKKLIASGSSCL